MDTLYSYQLTGKHKGTEDETRVCNVCVGCVWGGDGWGAECSVGLSVKLEGMCTPGLSFFPAPCPLVGPFVHTYYFPSASCQSHLLAHPNTHPTCGPNQYGYVGLTISTQ